MVVHCEWCGTVLESGDSYLEYQGYHVAKPGFDLLISREFLQAVDYTEMRRIELVMRDLMKALTGPRDGRFLVKGGDKWVRHSLLFFQKLMNWLRPDGCACSLIVTFRGS